MSVVEGNVNFALHDPHSSVTTSRESVTQHERTPKLTRHFDMVSLLRESHGIDLDLLAGTIDGAIGEEVNRGGHAVRVFRIVSLIA